jgi:hypothetical protein
VLLHNQDEARRFAAVFADEPLLFSTEGFLRKTA